MVRAERSFARRFAAASVWFIFLALCAWITTTSRLATDLTLFLPADNDNILHHLREGPAARLLLIGLDGDAAVTAAMSQQMAQQLDHSGLFARVHNGSKSFSKELQPQIFAYRYLLSPEIDRHRFSAEALSAALKQRLRALGTPLGILEKPFLASDPTAEAFAFLRTLQHSGSGQPRKHLGVWFDQNHQRALLLAETLAPAYDLIAQESAIRRIETTFADLQSEQTHALKLLVSGPASFAVAARDTIRSETRLLSMAGSLLLIAILVCAYRSARLLTIGALPLLFAVLAACAAVVVVFGELYAITLAFGVTILGVAIDYPIHFFSHLNRCETHTQSLRRIWPTLRLSALTTALGYSAMLSIEFRGLAQLGLFAITGLLTAAAVTRFLLPILIPDGWKPSYNLQAMPQRWLMRIGTACHRRLLIAGCLVLTSFVLFSEQTIWEDRLAALSPVPSTAVALDQELRAALGAPEVSKMLVIDATDAETVLRRSETLQALLLQWIDAGLIDGFEMAAQYLPSAQRQKQRQALLPEPELLRDNLDQAVRGLPFKADLFEPFLAAVQTARTLAPLTPADLAQTSLGLRLQALLFTTSPTETTGSRWLALIPLVGVHDSTAITTRLGEVEHVRYLDLRSESERLVAGFRDAAFVRLAIGGILILSLLSIGLRSLRKALITALPVVLALLLTIALFLLLDIKLSLFHLVTLLLVLGVGLDYSLFFGRDDTDEGMRARTMTGILLCSGSTIAVFGMLAVSELPVLRAIGLTAATGICVSLVTVLILAQKPKTS